MKVQFLDRSVCGQRLGTYESDNFNLLELLYSPGHIMPRHTHDLAYLEYHLRGSYTERYGHKTRSPKPATIVFHDAGEDHSEHYHNSGSQGFFIEIKPPLVKHIGDYDGRVEGQTSSGRGTLSWLAMRLYREFLLMDAVAPLAMDGLVFEMIAELARWQHRSSASTTPRWLQQTRELLHERFADRLTINAIAQTVGVHPSHLTRAFRQHFRCTIGDYVRKLWIEFACRTICASDISLTDVASSAGFADHSHFSRNFKLYTGQTPAEFRKNCRKR
jgi:AraC family transcriptional regulator